MVEANEMADTMEDKPANRTTAEPSEADVASLAAMLEGAAPSEETQEHPGTTSEETSVDEAMEHSERPSHSEESSEEIESDDQDPAPLDDKARETLKQLGLSESTIDGMDEEEIQRATKYAKDLRAKNTRMYQQLQEFENKADTPTEEAPNGQPSLDVEALSQPLTDLFGDDAAPMGKAFEAIVQHHDQRYSVLEGMVTRLLSQQYDVETRAQRQQLGERFPELLDDEAWGKVETQMRSIAGLKQNHGRGLEAIPEIMEFSARGLGLKEIDPVEASNQKSQSRGRKRAGQSSGAGKRGGSTTGMTAEQMADRALAYRLDGEPEKAVKLEREVRRLRNADSYPAA